MRKSSVLTSSNSGSSAKVLLSMFLSNEGGGVEEGLPSLFEDMLARGWIIHHLSPAGFSGVNHRNFFHHPTSERWRRLYASLSFSSAFYSLQAMLMSVLIQKKQKISVVYVSLLQDFPTGLMLRFLNRNTRIVYSVHSDALKLTILGKSELPPFLLRAYVYLLRKLERMALERSNLVVFVSAGLMHTIESYHPGLSISSIRVILNSIPATWRRQEETLRGEIGTKDVRIVGYLGKLTKAKGVFHLLDAFAILKEAVPNALLVFVGDGMEEKSLRSLVSRRGIGGVHFLGWREDVIPLVAGFDVLVLPSLSEGFGRALLAGLVCDIPTFGSKVDGIVDVLGFDDLMFEPGDVRQLAEKLISALRSNDQYDRLKELGRQRLQALKSMKPQSVADAISWTAENGGST